MIENKSQCYHLVTGRAVGLGVVQRGRKKVGSVKQFAESCQQDNFPYAVLPILRRGMPRLYVWGSRWTWGSAGLRHFTAEDGCATQEHARARGRARLYF